MIKKRLLLRQVQQDFHQIIIKDQIDQSQLKTLINRYLSYSPAVAIFLLEQLLRLAKKQLQKGILIIESGDQLSKSDQDKIKQQYAHYPIQQVQYHVNTSLLGGIKVRIGDDVYEDSVHSRIDQLKGAIIGIS